MDSFAYTVTDGEGAYATGSIIVNLAGATGAVLPAGSIKIEGETATISSFGIPGLPYVLQTATNVHGPWIPALTNSASPHDGTLLFVLPQGTNPQQYYRTAQP